MQELLNRFDKQILGVLSCFDRVVLNGTVPHLGYAKGMTSWLYKHHVRIFDYPKWAEQLRNKVRANAERIAKEHDTGIEFVAKSTFSKEALVKKVIEKRGDHPGLVHILSAMEGCQSYRPWFDKKTGKSFLLWKSAQCLHYYFYFIDEVLGLCYVRVPTWAPFRLQIYYNGHNVLARKLDAAGIGYRMVDNAFADIDDFAAAQLLAHDLDTKQLHGILDGYAKRYCPVIEELGLCYYWSIKQIEYATDIVFKRREDLAPLYEVISRTAVHAVKARDVATFLGHSLANYKGEVCNRFNTRIEGTRIKHHMGAAAIKMYDKRGIMIRVETTANDVSFFKHHRKVDHRDGTSSYKIAPVRKNIYSLDDLTALLGAANLRYLAFIDDLIAPAAGIKKLRKVVQPATSNGRRYRGFNFFSDDDLELFHAICSGEHTISGFRNRDLRQRLEHLSSGQISRLLKSLRLHGLIKRIGRTYKYYLTKLGRRAILTGLKLRTLVVIPELAIAD